MARKARVFSSSGMYYILLRSDENIFKSDDDAALFLACLQKEKSVDFVEIFAYCLYNEEIHLIIKEGLCGISKNILKICSMYVNAINLKYNRTGSLFKGRFVSFPIETSEQLLFSTRKAHRTALLRGLKLDYVWSSYSVYFKKSELLSSDAVILVAGSIIDFKLFTERPDKTEVKALEKVETLSSKELVIKIKEMFEYVDPKELELLSDEDFKILLKKIKKIKGATNLQISQVLNIDLSDVENV